MADFVRHVLEDMVPELDDLERRGYFTKSEIKQIVHKRQDFEYTLRRRAALKTDFLRCIEYEVSLERLRQLRRKQRAITGPSSLADHCITRRIHFIYERMLRKFRGDLALWSRWLSFCQRSKSSRQMSKVLTRALQLHPLCAALWTYAASWEFESNGNAAAARALMQRGLRMCKEAPALWHEYFRMELLYAMRLVTRREVLGLAHGAVEEDAASELVLRGAVAKVVYTNAIAALPDSLAFRAGFLNVLEAVELPGKEDLENHILDNIASDFVGSPGAVDLDARRRMRLAESKPSTRFVDAVDSGLEIFQNALNSASSEKLWDAMLAFTEEQMQRAIALKDAAAALSLGDRCLDIVHKAVNAGQASDWVFLTGPRANLRLGRLKDAVAAAELSNSTTTAPSAVVVRQRLGLYALSSALQVDHQQEQEQQNNNNTVKNLAAAVVATAGGNCPDAWLTALRLAAASGQPLDSLATAFIKYQTQSVKGPVRGGMGVPAACLVVSLWSLQGPESARQAYRSLFSLPMAGGELIHAVLDAELSLSASGGSDMLQLNELRELFEVGVSAYGGDDVDLWLRFVQFEQQHDGGKNAGRVHWRAIKALDDADVFVARSHLKNIGISVA